jgi:hypothetical protein
MNTISIKTPKFPGDRKHFQLEQAKKETGNNSIVLRTAKFLGAGKYSI